MSLLKICPTSTKSSASSEVGGTWGTNLPLSTDTIDNKSTHCNFAPMAKILVLEDSPDMQSLLKKVLSPQYELVICSSLSSARDYLSQQSVDLLLLDLLLPDGNGVDLCRD